MLYLISGVVIYDTQNGTLRLTDQPVADSVTLTTIANKILYHLVLHHGELVTRDTLFDEIWEKEGIAASSNTLNQYISLLRKMFVNFLGEKDVIVTVPRSGYYFSKEISVTHNNNVQKRHSAWTMITVSVAILSVIISGIFLFTAQPAQVLPRKIGLLKGCPVFDISGVKSDIADATSLEIAGKALEVSSQSCTENTAFYIYVQEALHLHRPARVLFSSCIEWQDNRDTCQNIYYYTWVN
ncbi:transcriptional regulator [Enterobacteriaceae bacterium C23F]